MMLGIAKLFEQGRDTLISQRILLLHDICAFLFCLCILYCVAGCSALYRVVHCVGGENTFPITASLKK